MLLEEAKREFEFDCRLRKLSDKTIKNYLKLLTYLFNYLRVEYDVEETSEVTVAQVKAFLIYMQRKGRTVNYQNDLLKVFKVFFRYIYEEGYTQILVTNKIKNARP